MSLNDSIQELHKLRCNKVTFGTNEQGTPCAACEQHLQTDNGIYDSMHQCSGESPVDLVNKLLVVARHCFELHTAPSQIVKMPGNGGRG